MAYNAGGYTQIFDIVVEGNYQSGEGCMEEYRDDDGAMDGALNETESQWPSEEAVRMDSKCAQADSYRLGLCLEVRAKGMVGVRW